MAQGVRTISIRFLGDTKDLQRASQQAGQQLDGWRSKLEKLNQVAVGAAMAIGAGAIAIGKDLVNLASQAEQSRGAVDSVFGEFAAQIEQLAQAAADSVGLSATSFRELASLLGAQLKNMGVPMEQVAGQTEELITLGADLAATFGGTTAEAVDALSALLRGESDPIERYGVSIKQADINARLAAEGLDHLEGAARKEAETKAILALLTEQTADAQGQFARESDTAAGQAQRAQAKWENLRTELGTQLLPIVTKIGEFLSGTLLPVLQNNQDVITKVAIAVVGLAGAVLAINAAVKVWRATVVVATAVQWLWNAALSANPIGLVILAIAALIAAIVLLWKNSETFRDIVMGVWEAIKGAAGAVGRWFSETLWGKWIKGTYESIRKGISGVADWISDKWGAVMDFFRSVPGKLKEFFGRVKDFITAPFRTAFNFVADAWNNTVGQLRWTVPNWVPGIGGNTVGAPQLPKFHNGGVMPGGPHDEGLALLRGREVILTPEQAAAIGGGDVYVIIDGRALDESMVRVVRKRDRDLRRRVLAGTGAAR